MSTTTKDIWLIPCGDNRVELERAAHGADGSAADRYRAWRREGARARARAGVVCARTDEPSAASADVFYQEVEALSMCGSFVLVAGNALLLKRTKLGGTR